jgi:hypothetical protein
MRTYSGSRVQQHALSHILQDDTNAFIFLLFSISTLALIIFTHDGLQTIFMN